MNVQPGLIRGEAAARNPGAGAPSERVQAEIVPLTGLRGLAALLVMVYHFGQPYETLGIATHFGVRQGYLAVDTFYLLSGFVLAYTNAAWFRGGISAARFGAFLLRRIARLYPAYLTILLVIFVKTVINLSGNHALQHYRLYDYVGNLLMMTGWGLNVYPLIADSWSVSAELLAYLLFPVLVSLAVFSRPAVAAAVFMLAAAGIYAVAVSGLGVKGPLDVVSATSIYPLLRCTAVFTFGLLLYRLFQVPVLRRRVANEATCALAVAAPIVAWALHAPDLVLFACLPPPVLLLAFDGKLARLLCANSPARHLGKISYSLYLIHPMLVTVAVRLARIGQNRLGLHDTYWAIAATAVAASIGLATLSYRFVEAPGKRWVQDFAARFLTVRMA